MAPIARDEPLLQQSCQKTNLTLLCHSKVYWKPIWPCFILAWSTDNKFDLAKLQFGYLTTNLTLLYYSKIAGKLLCPCFHCKQAEWKLVWYQKNAQVQHQWKAHRNDIWKSMAYQYPQMVNWQKSEPFANEHDILKKQDGTFD